MSAIEKLVRYENNGIELLVNCNTGESFATAYGYSRMTNKEYDTIKKRCQRGGLSTVEIPTAQGVIWGTLITEQYIVEWLPKDNPTMATQLMKLGVRAFLHQLAGYEIKSTAVQNQFTIPETLSDALYLAADLAKKNEVLIEKNTLLKNHNDNLSNHVADLSEELCEQKPLVKLSETLTVNDVDTVTVSEFAKSFGIGRNIFFSKLRQIGFIQKSPSTLPYQKHIENKNAEVFRKERPHHNGIFDSVTVLTAKGQEYIARKLTELERAQNVEVQMEEVLVF